MCGIVGYLGDSNGIEVVLEGLTRLEYRGYDSAGISFINDSEIITEKKTGKIENLKKHLLNKHYQSHSCIGHTRWATHGVVNEINAHPHESQQITMVHNGIIENATQLKKELIGLGENFKSETDSESFVVLVNYLMKEGSQFKDAVLSAFKKVDGNSSFVILDKENNQIACIKRSAPLVCGQKSEGKVLMASSDPYALVGMVDDLFFPGDETLVLLDGNTHEIKFYNLDGEETTNFIKREQNLKSSTVDKGPFEHYMLKEIHEQPILMKDLADFYGNGRGLEWLENFSKVCNAEKVHIVACGTAWHAGLLIKNYLNEICEIECIVELASEFRYKKNIFGKNHVGLFISQSGETADTLAAMELCEASGLPTIAIVNVENSTLYRQCDHNFLINAGFEVCVASTKAFTQMSLTGYILSDFLRNKKVDQCVLDEIQLLSARYQEIMGQYEQIKSIAETLYNKKGYIFTGRGSLFPIALEGALKLKEIAYVHAEGYASGELKHGPIALIDEEMVNVALVSNQLYEKTVSNIEEVKARKGIIFIIGPKGDKHLEELGDFYFPVNLDGLDNLAPLLTNLVLQFFSYYMALFKGTDIDKPRNLAKSVTVE